MRTIGAAGSAITMRGVGMNKALIDFNPKSTVTRDAVLGYALDHARKIRDWPALERAVEEKIEEQAAFVAWWRATVTPNQGRPRKSGKECRPELLIADIE